MDSRDEPAESATRSEHPVDGSTAEGPAAVDSPTDESATDPPTLSKAGLALGWREHRRYFFASVVLFALGTVVGLAIHGQVDLFEAMGLDSLGDVLPENPTATFVFLNNARVFLLFALAPVTIVGVLLTLAGLLFNGLLVGYVAAAAAAQVGVGFVLLALIPHGIIELPALFLGSAIGFRIVAVPVLYLLDRRERLWTRAEIGRVALLLVVGVLALAVAAVIEMHLTVWLLEQFFGGVQSGAAR
ncbi:stage II sporulation protein M [Haloarchaeobius sp. DFWS5]|uniref:stage II sporulation protein M n=1 Tax=Haloarchaeobius sp. DFWS5 TaxID=3446114 RepID=UPI003EC0DB09